MILFDLSEEDVLSREGKKRITSWKWEDFHQNISHGKTGFMTVRDILQTTGTELVRDSLNTNHWVMLAEKVVLRENANFSIFTDTRFENEIALVKKYDGIIVNVFGRVDPDVPLHSSELLRADYDYRINNDYETTEDQVIEQIKTIILRKWPDG